MEVAASFTRIVEDRREIIINHYRRKRERQIPSPQKSFGKKKNKTKANQLK